MCCFSLSSVIFADFDEFGIHRTESASLIGDNNLDEDVGRSDTKEDNNLELAISDVTNNRWKKCAALKESETDITTQEEFYKFDFQVNETIPHYNLISIYIKFGDNVAIFSELCLIVDIFFLFHFTF